LDNAGWALHRGAVDGDVDVRAGEQFATVIGWGRILVVMARVELKGICHPDANSPRVRFPRLRALCFPTSLQE
jgi:hypothetical protein